MLAITSATILDAMGRWISGERVPTHAEIVETFGEDLLMYRSAWARRGLSAATPSRIQQIVDRYRQREEAIERFGFAIPCAEFVEACAKHQPIIEIGAGSGYLTAVLRAAGIDALSSDPALEQFPFVVGAHDARQLKLQGKTAVRRFPNRAVLCSWPSLSLTWFRQALRAMEPGRRVIIVREDATANDDTWEYLESAFRQEADIPVPTWPMLNDRCEVWRKGGRRCSTSSDRA